MEILEILGFKEELELKKWVELIFKRTFKGAYQRLELKDDLISEGMLAAVLLVRSNLQARKETVRAYAYVRVRGAMLDHVRSEAKYSARFVAGQADLDYSVPCLLRSEHSEHTNPEFMMFKKDLQGKLKSALRNLSKLEQDAIMLRHFFDFSFDKISKACGRSGRGSTCKLYNRALNRMQEPCRKLGLQSAYL